MPKVKISVAVQTDISEMLSASSSATTSRSSSEPDLLAAWEDLLGWSENAAIARKLQEEMIILKHALNRLGNKSSFELLDTEPSIQIAIEALKNEKIQLQTNRTNMLRLNASVHNWLTKQERKLQNALAEQQLREAAERVTEELLNAEAATATSASANAMPENLIEKQTKQKSEQQIMMNMVKPRAEATEATETEAAATTSTATAIVNSNEIAEVMTTTTITVTDSNGNQLEKQQRLTTTDKSIIGNRTAISNSSVGTTTTTTSTTTAIINNDKIWDLKTLMNSEQEFHKYLKDEVSDMYSAWDEADARINTQLDVLTTSLIAWRQLECGLSEFQQALGQDRGTLKGLEGALDKGQATPVELAQNVKLVAKLLSEKVNVSQEQLTAVQEHLDPNQILNIAKFTASNGSLSDSGISDGGATSDGGLSERERRLGVLRRLAKQLESALAPGSEAMKSIAARMESAEAELKNLQNTCRDLIVRTAATHHNKRQSQQNQHNQQQQLQITEIDELKLADNQNPNFYKTKENGHAGIKKLNDQEDSISNSPKKRKNKRKQRNTNANHQQNRNSAILDPDDDGILDSNEFANENASNVHKTNKMKSVRFAVAPDSGDPADDPPLEFDLSDENGNNKEGESVAKKNSWIRRVARAALPMQMAFFTFLFAATMMQPNCCDNLNNLAMSFTPQLTYVRGPPPI